MKINKISQALAIALLGTSFALATPSAEAAAPAKSKKEQKKPKTIAEAIKDQTKIDGLFDLYQDPKTGKLSMVIKKDQLGKEFLHFVQLRDGLVDVGMFRGAYRGTRIYSIDRHYKNIEFKAENTSFYFDPDNAVSKAKDANINSPVVTSLPIIAEDKETGDVLISADKLFLSESLLQIKPSPRPGTKPGQRLGLGKLSKNKTKYVEIDNYPENTDFEVEYVYDNPAPIMPQARTVTPGLFAVTDPRSIEVSVRHSLIEVPKNDYQPRFDDPRVGYFMNQVHDMTAVGDHTPYRDVIRRWHLVKKDPAAELSEPVEPIVWWIENTTPEHIRETVKNATLEWNKAFEKAGFKNAIQVKIQPDDADWDAGDIRYNVLRWTSSPRPPFGGYGPSFANPRTGQLLGADIMLEYSVFNRVAFAQELMATTAISMQEAMEQSLEYKQDLHQAMYQDAMDGRVMMEAMASDPEQVSDFLNDFIHFLILHEVGHTLGLNHNMKSSQLHDIASLSDKSKTASMGLTGSVMDYPAINFSTDGKAQGNYYTTTPGPYDLWAIEFGYKPSLEDANAEKARLETLLARSTEPELAFGNDADDMRAPGKAIDPRINVGDMSSDAIGFATNQMDYIRKVEGELIGKLVKEGDSYQGLLNGFSALARQYGGHARTISRYIGGVYIDRGFAGQQGATEPLRPVEKAKQKQAMDALAKYIFAEDAFDFNQDLVSKLQLQRRGFNHYGFTEDPKLHDMVLNTQRSVLVQLLHPVVQKRIVDSAIYGNQYPLSEVMNDLTQAVFKGDSGDVNSMRQNLQIEYIKGLARIVQTNGKAGYSNQSVAQARQQLKNIDSDTNVAFWQSDATKAHNQYVKDLIKVALELKKV
ncbi:zinc-dependent metalloprotease [Kangiella sp. TOML190]|uniref:zinc-dependent metalloprotease n=1 Tax=Kangiella sp. TOML190 TaxID=2931351 RepID=UPI00203F4990|nr:zinc-dependent metalloprotease [Kangiella sp. TOML190]